MTTLVEDDSPLQEFLFGLHISVGVTLLVLMVARVAIRLLNRPPPLPDRIGPFKQGAFALLLWSVFGEIAVDELGR